MLRLLHDASVCWLVIRCRANLIKYVYCQIQLVVLYNFAVPIALSVNTRSSVASCRKPREQLLHRC